VFILTPQKSSAKYLIDSKFVVQGQGNSEMEEWQVSRWKNQGHCSSSFSLKAGEGASFPMNKPLIAKKEGCVVFHATTVFCELMF